MCHVEIKCRFKTSQTYLQFVVTYKARSAVPPSRRRLMYLKLKQMSGREMCGWTTKEKSFSYNASVFLQISWWIKDDVFQACHLNRAWTICKYIDFHWLTRFATAFLPIQRCFKLVLSCLIAGWYHCLMVVVSLTVEDFVEQRLLGSMAVVVHWCKWSVYVHKGL